MWINVYVGLTDWLRQHGGVIHSYTACAYACRYYLLSPSTTTPFVDAHGQEHRDRDLVLQNRTGQEKHLLAAHTSPLNATPPPPACARLRAFAGWLLMPAFHVARCAPLRTPALARHPPWTTTTNCLHACHVYLCTLLLITLPCKRRSSSGVAVAGFSPPLPAPPPQLLDSCPYL